MEVTEMIKPIYNYYVYGGINPFVLEGNKIKTKRTGMQNLYSTGIFLTLTVCYIWTVLDKYYNTYLNVPVNFQVMDISINLINYAYCLTGIYTLCSVTHAARIIQLILYIENVDKFLMDPKFIGYKKMGKYANFQMMITMAISIGLIIISYVCSHHDIISYIKSELINCISLLYFPTTSLPIISLPYMLLKRFEFLNVKIIALKREMKSSANTLKQNAASQKQFKGMDVSTRIQQFGKVHALLGNIGDLYSTSFGPLAVVSTVVLTCALLNFCFQMLMFLFNINPYGLRISDVIWTGVSICSATMAHSVLTVNWSNAASIEACRTIQIVHEMILEIPTRGTNGMTHIYKQDLLELARQISRKPVILTATNWYQMKYSFLYTILNGVLSFFILLIQLNF